MKKINLEEILEAIGEKEFDNRCWWYTTQSIISAMKEACRQTLELAAENADAGCDFGSMKMKKGNLYATFAGHIGKVVIDKQSILDTINQIE